MRARDVLVADVQAMQEAIKSGELQTLALLPINELHNRRAQVLRRGLYVVGFNAIEQFLKARSVEHLTASSATSLSFDELPPGMQKAAVHETLESALKQARFDPDNSRQILQEAAAAVASTTDRNNFTIHRFSTFHSNSNISDVSIGMAISALHVENPWNQMQRVLEALNMGGLPLIEQYKEALRKRNASAHSQSSITVTDLTQLKGLAVALCCAFDIVYSIGMLKIHSGVPTPVDEKKGPVVDRIQYITIKSTSRGWAKLDKLGRPTKYYKNFSEARAAAATSARSDVLIIRSDRDEVQNWDFIDSRIP